MADLSAALRDWLSGLDADELTAYRIELELFADDPTDLGRFAAAALPLVRATEMQRTVRAFVGDAFEQVFGEDGDTFVAHLAAINQASRELAAGTDPLEVFDAALATSRAAARTDRDGDGE